MASYYTNAKCKTFYGDSEEVETKINNFLSDNGYLGISIMKMTQCEYNYYQRLGICVTIIYRTSGT